VKGLALLHGFTGCPESWDAVVGQLPPGHEVYRPALYGHGPGSRDGVGSFEDEVDRLAHRIGERIEPPVVLAGYSMGGRVALGLLVRHRRLFGAAVLIGTHPGIAEDEARRRRIAGDEVLARRLEERGIEDFVDAWEALPLLASQRRLPAAVLDRQRALRLRHDPCGLAAALRVLGAGRMPDYRPHLGSVEVPVRLLAGAEDDKFLDAARDMTERLPRATVEVVPAAGHNLLLEAPAAVAAAIAGVSGSISRGQENHEHPSR
jgi:2-succinyl-6-hydroxy-2,4-cyclohexadiene-1-carboxylate synthase